jgi:hypothetical protein
MVWSDILKMNFQRGKILNWTYFNITEDFETPTKKIIEQMDDYRNLENDGYWRSKMTDEERKMKRHPNRSPRWIPNRLEKQRDELRYTLLDFIVGPENYGSGNGWYWGKPCKKCETSFEIEKDAMAIFQDTLKEELGSEYGTEASPEEYTAAKEKGLSNVYDKYGYTVTERLPYNSYQQGRIPSSPSRPYGMCRLCYEEAVIKMRAIVNSIYNEKVNV